MSRKDIEEFELKMFILKRLKAEFELNVRILESQTNVTINDMRYTLKQEELRREKGRVERDNENVRKVRESARNNVNCFKCSKRDHFANQCHARCFNCNGAYCCKMQEAETIHNSARKRKELLWQRKKKRTSWSRKKRKNNADSG